MGSWRDIAAAAQRQDPEPVPTTETFGLPDDLAGALRRLETLPPPRKIENVEIWRRVVADALRIARDRWAVKALAMGWTVGDLFGVGPRDDWDFQGLAAWLDGMRIVMLDDVQAISTDNAGKNRYFIRGGMRHGTHPTITPVMLWDFGR